MKGPSFAARVASALRRSPNVDSVELVGSRARGTAGPLSDWDFAVATDDFDGVAAELPGLVAPLGPLAQQWDPLGNVRCYMLTLPGAVKVDLIFDVRQDERDPWEVTAETLPAIDAHFWDWILWLAAKERGGKSELVATEFEKMQWFLLGPLGVEERPASIERAVELYDAATPGATKLGDEVRAGLRAAGFAV